ncbi:MAG: PQQ-binding-like beta-propeller repeat protein, partial [bacterium]|nr:PQQ-binding-like beta-propeller repeat protein [bacterium]
MPFLSRICILSSIFILGGELAPVTQTASRAADWPQLQGDALRSGNAQQERLSASLGLLGSLPLSDAILASPVISGKQVFVVDASGTVFAIDVENLQVQWKFVTEGGAGNCNNVAAPAVVGDYVHVGTMAGFYYVLNRRDGSLIRKLDCGEPIFAAPVIGSERVYVATLGARIFALKFTGETIWSWDFVREVIGFQGDRWSGADWLGFRGDRVNWRDHFVCSRDICLIDRTVVMPAGGRTIFVEDQGDHPRLRAIGIVPEFAGEEYPATFGQSADESGNVYVQWHRRDNAGRVEIMRLNGDSVETSFVPGTETSIERHGLLSFAPVAVRDQRVFRVRPEHGVGLCSHQAFSDAEQQATTSVLSAAGGISPAVLTAEHAVYAGLDGNLHLVSLDGASETTLRTRGAPISAPIAVADGRIVVGGEDGYLYIFGSGGQQEPPDHDLGLHRIRSPLTGPRATPEFDWYTNYGDFQGTNANNQDLAPPLRMRWAQRLQGTVKHLPVCGGGRLYMHTAEGQIIAVEQDTGRLLWRRYWPDVYLSFTSPLYYDGKLIVPQAGIKRSLMRCLDAETGELLWETPFTGSPSWSRQFPPVVENDVVIYASGTGEYAAQGTEKPFIFRGEPVDLGGKEVMSWIYSNDNPYYPKNQSPKIWAWDLNTGQLRWEKDFSEYGRGGNDCGICLYDGKFYYSVFFGYAASQRARRGLPAENNGLTVCLDPKSGEILWKTTDYYVTSKCTLSARDGQIYIGGYNPAKEGSDDRFVWQLDAKDGSLTWKSDPVTSALNVVSVGEEFIFSNALRGKGNVFDKQTGKVLASIGHNYACCRFTLSEPYVLGANMDMID